MNESLHKKREAPGHMGRRHAPRIIGGSILARRRQADNPMQTATSSRKKKKAKREQRRRATPHPTTAEATVRKRQATDPSRLAGIYMARHGLDARKQPLIRFWRDDFWI